MGKMSAKIALAVIVCLFIVIETVNCGVLSDRVCQWTNERLKFSTNKRKNPFATFFRTLAATSSSTATKSTRKLSDLSAMLSLDAAESARMKLHHRHRKPSKMKMAASRNCWNWTLSRQLRISCVKSWARQRCTKPFKRPTARCSCKSWSTQTTPTDHHPPTPCNKSASQFA